MSSRTFASPGRRTLVRNGASVTLASRQLAAAAKLHARIPRRTVMAGWMTSRAAGLHPRQALFRPGGTRMQAPVELAMLSTAVFLGGLVSGFSGFAFSAAAGAILLHVFEPIAAIPLMMFCSIASQSMSLVKVYRLIRWRELAPLLIGGMAGAGGRGPLLATGHPHSFRIAFGLLLAGHALYMLMRHLLIRRPSTLSARAASGPALSILRFSAGRPRAPTPLPGPRPGRLGGAHAG